MNFVVKFFNKIYATEKKLLFFIFCFSVISSLAFLIFFRNIGPSEHQTPNTDYLVRYQPIADSILEGKGIRLEGKVEPGFAPGFSVILAGLFALSGQTGIARLDLIVLMNMILAGLVACLVFLIAREVFGKKIAVISSLLWMTYPFWLWFLKNPNSEVPFMSVFCLGIYLFVSGLKNNNLKLIFFSGLGLGLSSLIRLPALFFPLFIALLSFFILRKISFKRRFLLAAILLAGNILALLPWGVYSFLNTGSFVPVSNLASSGLSGGFTFLLGTDSGKITLSDKTREALYDLKSQCQLQNCNKALIEAFKSKPAIFLNLTLLRVVRAWYATGMMWWENVILAVQAVYLSMALAGIIYALKTHKEKLKYIILFLGIIVYFWAMSFLAIPILRYLIPAMPLVIIFLAVFLDFLMNKLNLYGKVGFSNHSL